MTLLHLPWWAWMSLNLGLSGAAFVWRRAGLFLRAQHKLTCRAHFQLLAILDVASTFTGVCIWWLIGARWLTYFIIGMAFGAELGDVISWLRRRLVVRRTPWESPYGLVQWAHLTTSTEHIFEAWRHRKHDDDCEHGPVKRWIGATAKLRSWDKVAINPDFAPS